MKNNLSENLKSCCKIRNKTLTDFSQELGIPRTTINSIIKNEGNTTVDTALNLAEKLNMTLDVLVADESGGDVLRLSNGVVSCLGVYNDLPKEKQEEVCFHITRLLEVLKK